MIDLSNTIILAIVFGGKAAGSGRNDATDIIFANPVAENHVSGIVKQVLATGIHLLGKTRYRVVQNIIAITDIAVIIVGKSSLGIGVLVGYLVEHQPEILIILVSIALRRIALSRDIAIDIVLIGRGSPVRTNR